MRPIALLLAATLVSVSSSAVAAPFSALYVFGDSLSDNGNLSILTGGLLPAAPYAPGVASNGPVAVDYLAASLGLPLAPALAGGTNYAIIGAATGPVAFPLPGAPGNTIDNIAGALGLSLPVPTGLLNSQVPTFLSMAAALPPGTFSNALFVLWGGANDIGINALRGLDADPTVPLTAAGRLGTAIDLLYGAGARQFLVPNLPDLGLTPGVSVPALGTAASMLFNTALDLELASRRLTLPGVSITAFDTFSLFHRVVAAPAAYGFSNIDDECYQGPLLGLPGLPGPMVCATPSAYLFWDTTHPTTSAHLVVADGLVEALGQSVPEPTLLVLSLVGGAGMYLRRRRGTRA